MTLDLTKPLQTRDGRKARLMGTLNQPPTDLVLAIARNGRDEIATRRLDGRFYSDEDHHLDIINVPEPKPARYLNVYQDRHGKLQDGTLTYDTRDKADKMAIIDRNRVGCIRVDLAERFDP